MNKFKDCDGQRVELAHYSRAKGAVDTLQYECVYIGERT